MSEQGGDTEGLSVELLQHQVYLLEGRLALTRSTDTAVEEALANRGTLEDLLGATLPLLKSALAAEEVFATALDAAQVAIPHSFCPNLDWIDTNSVVSTRADRRMIACRFVVADESFGVVVAAYKEAPPTHVLEYDSVLLNEWAEVLDDHLAMVALARSKHTLFRDVSRAFAEPLLERGLTAALKELSSAIAFDELVLVFRLADGMRPVYGRWLRFVDGEVVDCSTNNAFLTDINAFLGGPIEPIVSRLNIQTYREEPVVFGVHSNEIGRLIVGRRHREPSVNEIDVIQIFTDCLRQRLVDFTREHSQLAACFPPLVVASLLKEPSYRERFLAPREAEVAVMYADISGFTKISEELLDSPALIGRLVNAWSDAVVQTIWATGGVFDKMVGDCIIGLWGPPMFDAHPRQQCERALEAARRVRWVSKMLPENPNFPELSHLAGHLGVSIGLNFAPLYVGLFGPNDNYTGFSSGMNNTARLQRLASRDEILCMEDFVVQLEDGVRFFGELQRAQVKNVTGALHFRSLEEPQA